MLTWTDRGAVATPQTVQIRITRHFAGRVVAGAPMPSRTISQAELDANLTYFTQQLRGPRTRPCSRLVLSGLQDADIPAVGVPVRAARQKGLDHVTVHRSSGAGPPPPSLLALADHVAVSLEHPEALAALSPLEGHAHTVVIVLTPALSEVLPEIVAGLVARATPRVVFTWPFPPGPEPMAPAVAVPLLELAVASLEEHGVDVGIKGLPACNLGSLRRRVWRSANRWYVDADHQTARALLFFPDVVRWFKADTCRWCQLEQHCEGVVEAWWRERRIQTLPPVTDA